MTVNLKNRILSFGKAEYTSLCILLMNMVKQFYFYFMQFMSNVSLYTYIGRVFIIMLLLFFNF